MNAHCAWCRKFTREPVVVGVVGQDTSSGGTTYACPSCRAWYRLVPMADWKQVGDGRPQYYPAEPIPQ